MQVGNIVIYSSDPQPQRKEQYVLDVCASQKYFVRDEREDMVPATEQEKRVHEVLEDIVSEMGF